MKLEEDIRVLTQDVDSFSYDIHKGFSNTRVQEGILALISHAEATRWRKLSEETPPEKEKWYETWSPGYNFPEIAIDKRLWHLHFKPGVKSWGFNGEVNHWRHIVGPEKSEK